MNIGSMSVVIRPSEGQIELRDAAHIVSEIVSSCIANKDSLDSMMMGTNWTDNCAWC